MSQRSVIMFIIGFAVSVAFGCGHGQPEKRIDADTIAAFEKLGARFHPAWHDPWTEHQDRERGPKDVPMFRLDIHHPVPQKLPAVAAPFGFDLAHSNVTDANLKDLADLDNLVALNLRYTDEVTANGIKK